MDNKKWFKEAKMGMFIHWGLYSLPAGEWKGKRTEYPSEWVMTYNRIPIKEYEKLAGIFNPIYFDAEEWVKLAKEAGMQYITKSWETWHSSVSFCPRFTSKKSGRP